MAIFKCGDRVRVVHADPDSHGFRAGVVGKEATVISIPSKFTEHWPDAQCDIHADGFSVPSPCRFFQLQPLTDPKADAFIESLKRLVKEEEDRIELVKSLMKLPLPARELDKYRGGSQ